MTGIKSLADELRESLKSGNPTEKLKPSKARKNTRSQGAVNGDLAILFQSLDEYQLTGTEKILIRLDERTVFVLKQLKVQKGIDMNKAIAFFIKSFLESKPELTAYIKESLKTIEL
ncbi:hypothetical protein [Desertivirga xinjiangensis]|uniref:hypothetical protein n=1 Tax=Desertivirga xinjiangensis TaxID=539206 RepID=UPI00210A767B|nr:hypothetical protein [Pedobacter xinjiangensis]